MKKFTFKMLDGFRSSVSQPAANFKPEHATIVETLRSENFQVAKTVRQGFPYSPTALAFDPIQKLLAVGTKQGCIRIIGRPGVDIHLPPENSDAAIMQIVFLANEGALIAVTTDDVIQMWNFRGRTPELVHALKFQRERITYVHLPFRSKWLYIGTERGNVHVVNIEVFQLSGYVINWNKAIELSRKTHPGSVVHLSDCPVDSSKLLMGYETGQLAIWDLRTKTAESRYSTAEPIRSITWHHEGKQFMCSHTDGSLTTWTMKQISPKPTSIIYPHAKMNKEGKQETCKSIQKVEWTCCRNDDSFVIFSGGLSNDRSGRTPSITVIHGKTTTVLEMEHNVVDFITLCSTPWEFDYREPYALVVLLNHDLVVVDLHSPGYPCFENPYSMDLHESPVTSCCYLADCPADLIPALYPIGARSQKRTGFSDKPWPISGGEWGSTSCSYSELIITGHADGSLKFWDASSVSFQILYKLKTSKVFEKTRSKSLDGEDDPFAVQHISLCPESRLLCIAGASVHVMLFTFSKQETSGEVPCLEIPIVYEPMYGSTDASPEFEFPQPNLQASIDYVVPIHVKGGIQRKPPGYQAELVCLTPSVNGIPPGSISALTINSSYGLLAYGNESGLVIIDYIQKVCLLGMGTPELYGTADPYQRGPKSPKKPDDDRGRSPTNSSDQEYRGMNCVSYDTTPTPSSEETSSYKPLDATVVDEEDTEGEEELLTDDAKLISTDNKIKTEIRSEPVKQNSLTKLDFFKILSKKEKWKHKETSLKEEMLTDTCKVETSEFHSMEETVIPVSVPVSVDDSIDIDCEDLDVSFEVAEEAKEVNEQIDEVVKSSFEGESFEFVQSTDIESVKVPHVPKRKSILTQLNKLDAKMRKAFSIDHTSLTKGTSLTETRETEIEPVSHRGIPLVRCSPIDTSDISSSEENESNVVGLTPSPRASPKVSMRSISNYSQSTDDGGESHFETVQLRKDNPKSLALFDQDGNPIPPQRQRSDVKHSDQSKRKTSQGSGSLTMSHTTSPVNESDQPPVHVSSPVKSIRTFFGIGKKGSSGTIVDKLDGTPFSRSRSSSISSLENIRSESVNCLSFADSYTKKNENQMCPTLWVGTSLGSVIQVVVFLPEAATRQTCPVNVSPSGTIFRLKGNILAMSFLDCSGSLIPYTYESWRDAKKDKKLERTPTKSSVNNRMSPTNSGGGGEQTFTDRQFVVIASDKVARVVALPSHNCVYKQIITEVSFVVKAEIVQIKDAVCLTCYIATGHISIFSLPSLRQLHYVDFLPLVDLRIARTFCLTNYGHSLYLCSPSEIQKFTTSNDFCKDLQELLGHLFLPCETPEAPKQSWIRGFFGGGPSQLDREELFGENSGKASRSIAKAVGPTAQLESLNARSGSAASEISRTKMALIERGEKLGQLEDRTAKMMQDADQFGTSAHQLMLKYKDKKWYQL